MTSPGPSSLVPPPPPGAVPAPAPDAPTRARSLGLTDDEYGRVVATLGRTPSTAELGTYSVMWSEHCSYKSSRVHLRNLPTDGPAVLVGPGENAGVVDVGDGLAVTFKIESHNHPSYVEPFQGATTGVGGIVRDILTMGARPIALLDPLRFGDPASEQTRWIVDGVVRGVGAYGNSIGVPTVGGETVFDASYEANPLVNVMCAGVLPADRIQLARAESVGDVAVLIGQRTGRDGIGGASVLASAEFDESGGVDEAKRPNVQVGDPFAGKLLIESCLELYDRELLAGIQDMGAAGIACSTAEMASAAGLGMRVDLDRVPLRGEAMEAWEILCSESQERMLALVAPVRLDQVLAVCERWGVQATPIGEVTDGDRLVFTHHGELVHDASARSLAGEGPVYERDVEEVVHPSAGEDVDAAARAGPLDQADLEALAAGVLGHGNVASARWVHQQYDAIVGHATVAGPGGDAAVLRLAPSRDGRPARGIALAADGAGRACALDPEQGARRVVAEAARNVACTGARPVAATNCLNLGSPERPPVMGQLVATIRGMAAACSALGTPITGGNVSLYNATGDADIHPTPVVGVLGVSDDVASAVGHAFVAAGDALLLIGAPTRPGLAGSVWQHATQGRLAGRLVPIDLAEERALQDLLVAAAGEGLLRSAHDVADGGLLATLAESALPRMLGAQITIEPGVSPLQGLCSESPSRVLVSARQEDVERLTALADEQGVGHRRLGAVTDAGTLEITGLGALELADLLVLSETALPVVLGLLTSPDEA